MTINTNFLTPAELTTIIEYAKKFHVIQIFLFGSVLEKGQTARDIDIGVKGLPPAQFFQFYGGLSRQISRPIDIVDLSTKNRFNTLIERIGIKIYG